MIEKKKKGGNTAIKNNHFAQWLFIKIKSKKTFISRFTYFQNGKEIRKYNDRDLYRWCHGYNFPKTPILGELINDLHIYTGIPKCDLMIECLDALSKDFREYQIEQSKS